MTVDYVRPSTLDEALAVAAQGARIAAGCTDLYPATTAQSLEQDQTLGARRPILDITGVSELRGVSSVDGDIRIGAATTWRDIASSDVLSHAFDALKEAAREVGGVQIQNAGTIAGNLCTASPAADGVPPLLVLDADVELRSRDATRRLPLSAFVTGPRRTAIRPDEILASIIVPPAAQRGRSAFLKLGARRYLVISIAMTAVRLVVEDDRIASAAIAVGSCGPTAVRLPEIEAALVGQPAEANIAEIVETPRVAAALSPIDDIRGDAVYRIDAAAELVRRGVAALIAQHRQPAERRP